MISELVGAWLRFFFYHFHSLTPTLSISRHLCLSCTWTRSQTHLSSPLSGRVVFLCFSPTFHSQSQSPSPISNRQPTPLTHTSLTPTPTPTSYCVETGLFLEHSWWFNDVKSSFVPWIFREETGCFSFCPLTSISFPFLHPLFPSQKPFLHNTASPIHFLFLLYPHFILSLTAQLSTHDTTAILSPTSSHLHNSLIFSFSLSRLRSLSS